MNKYREYQEQVRQFAIDWQADAESRNYSYGELAIYQDMFSRLARRLGLVREFRENGII